MNLVKSCWIEVRPLITCTLETTNFVPVLDALYNLGKPFRFLIAATANKEIRERHLVRFYLQLQDEQTSKHMSKIIKALLDVEVVVAEPPEVSYRVCMDLELAKNYALAIVNYQEKRPINLIDRLTASIAGSEARLEITAQADPNATLNIQKYLYEKINHPPSWGRELINQGIDMVVGVVAGKTQNKSAKERMEPQKVDPWVGVCTKNAEQKLASNLFTCQILIQSNSTPEAQTIKSALPVAMNRLQTFKTKKHPQHTTTVLRAPSRHVLRNNILCRLWGLVPIGVLLIGRFLGLFDPTKFTTSTLSGEDFVLPILAASLGFCLFIAYRRRQPIVLSTQELAQIIGLPTAIEKLPIALGRVPLSRMQLDTQKLTKQQTINPYLTKSENAARSEDKLCSQPATHSSAVKDEKSEGF
ncbi:hypothetical protein [Candidatus Bathycorpusculum sp.]|uniref:hypothetical protein n=1 Tax=Candidatus Bathycorpusculum sp. TaxID=2994959 RepID=UPI00281D491F|nr:hypothetical protein [Candidatus Termitimicrobium sp.]MCL2431766.1 hypothetical protein [Candidatus Termitimicrobium sp.]